jgi:hypothetical protein
MSIDAPLNDADEPEERAPDVVDVIDRTALIENLLNQIITDFCAPRREAHEFMWSVLLDTSVLSLGAKAKVVMAVAQVVDFKLRKDPLHRIIALRNAFAHHATNAHPAYIVRRDPKQDSTHLQLWVLESSGKIEKLKRHEAFADFNVQYLKARESLVALKNLVRGKFAHSQ